MEKHDQIILEHILKVWRRSGIRLDRVWVARHEALEECEWPEVSTPLRSAWLIDPTGISSRSPDKYARFWVCQVSSPIASGCMLYDGVEGESWRFGLASYFQLGEAGRYCVEVMLHGLWGHGDVWRIEEGELVPVRSLWLS